MSLKVTSMFGIARKKSFSWLN